MHDIKAIRDNPAAFDAGLQRRGLQDQFSAKQILELDEQRRAHVTKLQEAQARRNAASKEIGKAKAQKDEATAAKLMAEVAALKDVLATGEEEERRLNRAIEAVLEVIPNIPLEVVPFGTDESGNVEQKERARGTPRKFDFKPKQHFELGEALGMMDFEAAAKVSGARFVFLKGPLARLERAIGQFMLDTHTDEFGYTEVNPPLLVRDAAAYGTGNLPKFEDQLFKTIYFDKQKLVEQISEIFELTGGRRNALLGPTFEAGVDRAVEEMRQGTSDNRFWLIPTAEISLTNLVREQILDEDELPKRFTACTPCFRSEAGAAGRDTRGMIRQHQFTKVELVSVTTPEKALEEHERMTKCAETILERLGLPFRTVILCTGDMGFSAQKTFDIEVWLPGQDAYREISSCSVCGDFQARRMGARYRPKGSKDVRFVSTLNGSALAVGRTLVAIMENYQQADGSIVVPEVLRSYMGGKSVISRA